MVEISPTAAREIKRLKSNKHPDSSLRLTIRSGGCSGLFYDLKFTPNAKTESENDNSPIASGDRQLEIDGISLVIDPESWEDLKNLKLDYSEDLIGGGFRFHNPTAQNPCGCGISFAKAQSSKLNNKN